MQLGIPPYMKSIESYIMNVWKCPEKPQVLGHDDGYFIFRFASAEDCDRLLVEELYIFHKKPFIVQTWDINF